MKNPLTVFLIIGGALTLVAIAAKSSLTNAVSFVVKKIKIGWEGISPTLDITIGVQNTTPASFTLYSMIGTVYLNGSKLGDVSNFTATSIAGNAETPVGLHVRIGLLGVSQQINDVIDIINGERGIAANLRFVGSVNIANIPYPIDVSYNIV